MNILIILVLLSIIAVLGIFVPGTKPKNTATQLVNNDSGILLAENGGINKSKKIKIRFVCLVIAAIIGFFFIIVGGGMSYNVDRERLVTVGLCIIAFVISLFIYNILLNRKVRSSIFIYNTYLTGLSSYGVSYKLTYDQITSIDVIKNERVLVINAAGRLYSIWVSSHGAMRIRECIMEQKKIISSENSVLKCICGQVIDEGIKFCSNCGALINKQGVKDL